jgi:4-hydroxy-4-methyl-2-oxoglutarate aldolase
MDNGKKSQGMDIDALVKSRAAKQLAEFPVPVAEMLDRYMAVTTPMINDALRERNFLYQTLPNSICPLRDEMKMAGIAFTIKGTKSLVINNEMSERAAMLESIPAHAVVAWDTSGDDESAQWGEVMTMAAVRRGCRGAVVDGGVRDTPTVLEQGFPLFVRYRSSNGMLGRFRIVGWDVPIMIGNVHIYPGDVVFGDMDGVIIVPRACAYEVLLRAEAIKGAESDIKKWIREGMSANEVVQRGGYF